MTSSDGGASPALMVAATLQGLLVPSADDLPTRTLGLGELLVLEGLAAGDAAPLRDLVTRASRAAGADPASLEAFVHELRARGLVGRFAPPHALPAADAHPAAAAPRDDEQLVLVTPVILRLGPAGFEQLDHDGRVRVRLSAGELLAADEFRRPATRHDAEAQHARAAGTARLDAAAFARLTSRLVAAGLLQRFDANDPAQQRGLAREDREIRRAILGQQTLRTAVDRRMAEHDAAARTRDRRTKVVPVHFQWQITPLALGMIMANARDWDGGRLREHYDFRPEWISDARAAARDDGPTVYLFSHYVWSSAQNLALCAALKAANPACITIHGGPDVPKYEGDLETWFRAHPSADVAVRNEGEGTAVDALAALVPALHGGLPDLSVLASVPGLAFRDGDRIVRTAERGRLEDLDSLPSPYLTGLFDSFGAAATEAAVLETNRGCPYGCTFCDWGSATLSRIRRFSLDRVYAELEWCAQHGIKTIGLADANFGIFERDVAIAEKVAELKRRYGFPHHLGLNYAKNSVKHLKPIVRILVDAGVVSYGQVSLQSMDEDTLTTINRANIKVEKYHELSQEFRRGGLPLFVDLMMGLPGATVQSFRNDLQQSVDREVIAKIHPTQLLVNSPMNEPSYRRTHGIETTPGALVTSTASYTTADYEEMRRLRRAFLLFEKFGILRHVARWLRQAAGVREIEFLERLRRDALAQPERWPLVRFTLEAVPGLMVPPGSWRLFLDEIRRYAVDEIGVADDDALATALAVQHALLPARERRFPEMVSLPHDYVAWHTAILAAKDAGHLADWPAVVPPLSHFPPGTLRVDDPHDVCQGGLGHHVESDIWGVWELDSPVSRPVSPLDAADREAQKPAPSPAE